MFVGAYIEGTSGYENYLASGSTVMFNIRWDLHEPVPGGYLWDTRKKILADTVKAKGHKIILNIKNCPKPYRKYTDYICSQPKKAYYINFINFANQAIKYYKADYVELWNEPDVAKEAVTPSWPYFGCWGLDGSDYANFVNTVYPYIKKSNSNVQVLAGALMNDSPSYLQYLSRARFDILSFHSYVYHGFPFSRTIDKIKKFSGMIRKPMIMTETSLLTKGNQLDTLFRVEQGKYFKYLITELPKYPKVLGFVWYTLYNNGWNGSDLYYKGETPAYKEYRKYFAGG